MREHIRYPLGSVLSLECVLASECVLSLEYVLRGLISWRRGFIDTF
jgi:hypothetical protein